MGSEMCIRDRLIFRSKVNVIHTLSITHGIVPDQIKVARDLPLFKAADRSISTNYGTVSIFPSFSASLGKALYSRLYNYLSKLDTVCDNQVGFR